VKVDLMKGYYFDDIEPIIKNVIQQHPVDAKLLYKYAFNLPRIKHGHVNTILEIGRYKAGSTVVLASATHNKDLNIISVDIEEQHSSATDWLDVYEQKHRIDIRVENSNTMKNIPMSLLFVDGDHTENGLKKDFEHHWNYLNQNGFCLVDDYDITDATKNGVAFFITDWIKKGYAEVVEVGEEIIVLRKLKNWE
jgi:hypothetical protein